MAKKITVVQGATREFHLRVKTESDGNPFDLTGLTAGDVLLQIEKADGDSLDLNLTSGLELTSAAGGLIKVTISAVNSALLKEECGQDMELTIVKSGKTYKKIIKGYLDVTASLFPA